MGKTIYKRNGGKALDLKIQEVSKLCHMDMDKLQDENISCISRKQVSRVKCTPVKGGTSLVGQDIMSQKVVHGIKDNLPNAIIMHSSNS